MQVSILLLVASLAAMVQSFPETGSRYVPVSRQSSPSSRRYLPVSRGRPSSRNQNQPRRQRPVESVTYSQLNDYPAEPPPYKPSNAFQSNGAGIPPYQPSNAIYQPSSAEIPPYKPARNSAASLGSNRGVKTYLPPSSSRGSSSDDDRKANYEFEYEVIDAESGNDFGQKESRVDDLVTGVYRVVLPDGRTQVVDYVADQGGYQPIVKYMGKAKSSGRENVGYRY